MRQKLVARGTEGRAALAELDAILATVEDGDYTAKVCQAKLSFADLAHRAQ